jgi:hypothetical protein
MGHQTVCAHISKPAMAIIDGVMHVLIVARIFGVEPQSIPQLFTSTDVSESLELVERR